MKTRLLTATLICLPLVACDWFSKDQKKDENTDSSSEVNAATSPATPAPKPRAHRELTWGELYTSKAREGIMSLQAASTGENAPPKVEEPKESKKEAATQVTTFKEQPPPNEDAYTFEPYNFTRIAGTPHGFCGVGPYECWGDKELSTEGHYIDVAQTEKLTCAISGVGGLECQGSFGYSKPKGSFKRIAAAGSQFCALGHQGKVECWAESTALPFAEPPADLEAKFIAVGERFACAADQDRKLRCWGQTEGLKLPSQPLSIKDMGAGSDFLCVLPQSGPARCFGDAPALPEQSYKGIGAGFGTVCVIDSSDKGQCFGRVTTKFDDKVKRFAVSKNAVCAQLESKTQRCVSRDGKELEVPKDKSEYLEAKRKIELANERGRAEIEKEKRAAQDKIDGERNRIRRGTMNELFELFPKAKLPLSFKRDASFSFGDRIPARFNEFFQQRAPDYLAGVHVDVEEGTQAITAFHLPSQTPYLLVYGRYGGLYHKISLASVKLVTFKIGRNPVRKATGKEMWLNEQGRLVTTKLEGQETTFLVNGSSNISRVECLIRGESWSEKISTRWLGSKEKLPAPQSISTSTEKEGCGNQWPFFELPEESKGFDPSQDNYQPPAQKLDSDNPCDALTDQTGNPMPGTKVAKLAQVRGPSNTYWTSADEVSEDDYNEGGSAFGRLTVIAGNTHWELSEFIEGGSRNGGVSKTNCYEADGRLVYFEGEVNFLSQPSATRSVKFSKDGKPENEKWEFFEWRNKKPISRAEVTDKYLIDELSSPLTKLENDSRISMIKNLLR